MSLTLDFNFMMENFICHKGISEDEMMAEAVRIPEACEALARITPRPMRLTPPEATEAAAQPAYPALLASPGAAEAYEAGRAAMEARCATRDTYTNPGRMMGFLAWFAAKKGKNLRLRAFDPRLRCLEEAFDRLWAAPLNKPYRDACVELLVGEAAPDFEAPHRAEAFRQMKAARMSMSLSLDEISPFTLGECTRLFELAACFAAALQNADLSEQAPAEIDPEECPPLQDRFIID